MVHHESKIQQNCVRWFRLQFPHLAKLLVAIPNGGARRRIEAAIMKAEGVTAGVADLALFYPAKGYHGLFVEMKTPQGKQQPSQKEWQNAVQDVGYKYIICRSFDGFMTEINDYLR